MFARNTTAGKSISVHLGSSILTKECYKTKTFLCTKTSSHEPGLFKVREEASADLEAYFVTG